MGVSRLNGRGHCLDLHSGAALRVGGTTRRPGVPAAWRDTERFASEERAALALAEAVTGPSDDAVQEPAYSVARQVVGEAQVSAVIRVAITNAFDRVSILSKHPVRQGPFNGGRLPPAARGPSPPPGPALPPAPVPRTPRPG
ncbi:carboxymuconolactone decarboxylase family protein [Streptomyces sp. NPDC051636]|uniref:carboxymuconolactone decarboxylase family protein n=1 Tax=Streptomyces sp. NPDC051636 TaxID=3365663 RepID=UPI00379B32E6